MGGGGVEGWVVSAGVGGTAVWGGGVWGNLVVWGC